MPTQEQYNVTKQKTRKLYAKITLLNYNFQKVDEWENIVYGNPNFSNDSNSDIRRTCSISLVPINKSFDVEYGNKIWIDKYFQIHLGIEDIHSKKIVYFNQGIYLVENPSKVYSATENTFDIQGVDLMAKLTGLRNGNLEGLEHIIPQGSNVRNAIISTIRLAGFNKYVVDECPIAVPNDIKIDVGGTVYDLLIQLRDILPNYQMYFDVDGVFHYDMIPSGKGEQIMVTDDIWNDMLISYSQNYDFDNIKNVIEVFGKTHDVGQNYAVATISGSTYNLNIANITTLYNFTKIGFTAPRKVNNPYIKLNSFASKPLKDEKGNFAVLVDEPNVYHVATYQEQGDYFLYLGEVSPYGYVDEDNEESPFYINGTMGRVRIVLSGGEYENIFTKQQAMERASYELYRRCRLQDSVILTCLPVYWLDVNWLIELTLPNKNGKKETNMYIIKSISTEFGVDGTQSIQLMRFYPYYPFYR